MSQSDIFTYGVVGRTRKNSPIFLKQDNTFTEDTTPPHRIQHSGGIFVSLKQGGELSPGLHKTTRPPRLPLMHSRGPCYYHPGGTSFCRVITRNTSLCVRRTAPYGDLHQDECGGRTESRCRYPRSFDSCFDSFDRSSAAAGFFSSSVIIPHQYHTPAGVRQL